MKLEIKLADKLLHGCFDGLLVSVAEWEKKDYRLAHAEAWDFIVNYDLDQNHPETSYGLLDKPNTLNRDLLKTYGGISYNYYEFNHNTDDFLAILKNELSNQRPIILRLDYYWCPWNKDVSKITQMPGHGSLVKGLDDSGIICLDYSPRCEKCIFPYQNIDKIDGYCTINVEEPAVDYNYNDIIDLGINIIEGHDIFNNLRKFGKYIRESFNPIKDLGYMEDNPYIPNLWQISLTAESRDLYSNTLRAIGEKYNVKSLFTIAERLALVKPMWSAVRILLNKIYLTKDLRMINMLAEKIYEIADYEEAIYNSLVLINKNPN